MIHLAVPDIRPPVRGRRLRAKSAPQGVRAAGAILAVVGVWALLAVAAGLVALIHARSAHPAQIWDARCFWELYVASGEALRQGVPGWLGGVVADIRTSDYNSLSVDLLLPVQALFGPSRPVFVTALVVAYLVPAALVLGHVSQDLAETRAGTSAAGRRGWLALSGMALVAVPLWAPTLSGMPDIVGTIPLLFLVLRLRRTDLTRPQPREQLVLLGLLAWLPFLCRRWYAYTVLSVLGTAAAFALVDHVRVLWAASRPDDEMPAPGPRIGFWPGPLIANLAVIGAVAAGLVLTLQGGLALRIATTSYRDAYSAYQLADGRAHIVRIVAHFGPLSLLLAAFGFAAGVVEAETRRTTLFVTLAFGLGAVLFAQVQLFADHHYLPLAMGLLLVTGIGLSVAWRRLARFAALRAGLVGGLAALELAAFVHGVGMPVQPLAPLFARDTAYPLRLENYPEYRRLSRDLQVLVGAHGTVSVFASSPVLCDSLLESLSGEALDAHLHMASQVDKRDLFDTDSLLTDYVVVADPVQTHLRPADQQVIVAPAEALLTGAGVGRAYRPLPQIYHLTATVTARVYARVRPFQRAEVDALFARLFQAHPEWRAIYGPARRGRIVGR